MTIDLCCASIPRMKLWTVALFLCGACEHRSPDAIDLERATEDARNFTRVIAPQAPLAQVVCAQQNQGAYCNHYLSIGCTGKTYLCRAGTVAEFRCDVGNAHESLGCAR